MDRNGTWSMQCQVSFLHTLIYLYRVEQKFGSMFGVSIKGFNLN